MKVGINEDSGLYKEMRAAARALTVKVVAIALGGACVVGLAAMAVGADRLRLGVSFVAALPPA